MKLFILFQREIIQDDDSVHKLDLNWVSGLNNLKFSFIKKKKVKNKDPFVITHR